MSHALNIETIALIKEGIERDMKNDKNKTKEEKLRNLSYSIDYSNSRIRGTKRDITKLKWKIEDDERSLALQKEELPRLIKVLEAEKDVSKMLEQYLHDVEQE